MESRAQVEWAQPRRKTISAKIRSKAEYYHERTPFFRKLPGSAIAIILLLVAVNILVWIACGVVLAFHRGLVTTAVLSYTLGLRHALDADHITAIDLMTRRLVASGQRPVTVGTFFSLGHSTVVIVTSIVVAASTAAISDRFGSFSEIGSIIGSSISAAFMILLGIMNAYILYRLYLQLQAAVASPIGHENLDFNFEGAGCMMLILRKMFKLVDRPWKMYPLGILFGLGLDTSSEIALLGIASIQATQGTSIWLILIFPILFTAGMCLLDTFDGAAMMSLYTSARLAKDAIAVLYYQCVLTAVTVVVAIIIGVIQLLNIIVNVKPNLKGPFWRGVEVAGDHYDIIGGSICGSFILFGTLSVLLYKPWRRRIDKKRMLPPPIEYHDVGLDEAGAEDDGRSDTRPAVGKYPAAGPMEAGNYGQVDSVTKGGTRVHESSP